MLPQISNFTDLQPSVKSNQQTYPSISPNELALVGKVLRDIASKVLQQTLFFFGHVHPYPFSYCDDRLAPHIQNTGIKLLAHIREESLVLTGP